MDLAILIFLIILAIVIFRDVKWVVFAVGTMEIFLRIINYVGNNIGVGEVANFVNKIPGSIFEIIGNYSSGVLYDILSWILVAIFGWFLVYLFIYLFKKK